LCNQKQTTFKNKKMKKLSLQTNIKTLRVSVVVFLLTLLSLFFFSFTVRKINNDFLAQLGITKTEADQKIANGLLNGYVDAFGVKNVKNILVGNRSAVVKELLNYAKAYSSSAAFKKAYNDLKESNKPTQNKTQTPDEMRKEMIQQYKKSIADLEITLKKADANTKPVFEKILADAKKELKNAEDPNNKAILNYTKNYPQMLKDMQTSYDAQIADWELKYPTNQLIYIKRYLQKFGSHSYCGD
jgi:uncharacterized protein YicC (UPF0701 family)